MDDITHEICGPVFRRLFSLLLDVFSTCFRIIWDLLGLVKDVFMGVFFSMIVGGCCKCYNVFFLYNMFLYNIVYTICF